MATVPFQDRLALTHPLTGITVGVYPSSDPFYDIQIYRAASTKSGAGPTSVPASSKFSELATLGVINGQASVTYRDSLPLSNTLWWYKARSVKTNVATPSAFTTAVYSQAGLMPTSTPGAIPWSGKPIQVVPRLTTNATPVYGTSSGSAYYKKLMTIPFTAFTPDTSTRKWLVGGGVTRPNYMGITSSVQTQFVADVVLPVGATITNYTAALFCKSTKGTTKAFLDRSPAQENGAVVVLSSVAASGSTWSFPTGSLTEVVSTANFYTARVVMTPATAGASDQRLGWIRLSYKITNLGVTI